VQSHLELPKRSSDGTDGTDASTARRKPEGWVISFPFTGDDKICACAQGAFMQLEASSKQWLDPLACPRAFAWPQCE
jgi:hypothetical protein